MDSETSTISKPIQKKSATRVQIRGSSLLLSGKFLSRGINMLVDVLIVRHLTQADFGAFAYALSIVTIVKIIATFGMDRAITRFVPIYQEQKEYKKMFGTVFMVFAMMLTLGLAMALMLNGFRTYAAEAFFSDQQALALLLQNGQISFENNENTFEVVIREERAGWKRLYLVMKDNLLLGEIQSSRLTEGTCRIHIRAHNVIVHTPVSSGDEKSPYQTGIVKKIAIENNIVRLVIDMGVDLAISMSISRYRERPPLVGQRVGLEITDKAIVVQ